MSYKYRYFCINEGGYIDEDVDIGNPAPTVCKNNAAHVLDTDSLTILKRNQIKNKYIGSDNYVVATALANNNNTINIDLSTTPAIGQSIVVTSPTLATWAYIPKDYQIASSTTNVTTTSTTYIDMSNMSVTTSNPGTMTYLIIFNGVIRLNSGSSRNIECIININGVDISSTHTTSFIAGTANNTVVTTSHLATISNGTIVKIRWKTSGGTAIVFERNLIIAGV